MGDAEPVDDGGGSAAQRAEGLRTLCLHVFGVLDLGIGPPREVIRHFSTCIITVCGAIPSANIPDAAHPGRFQDLQDEIKDFGGAGEEDAPDAPVRREREHPSVGRACCAMRQPPECAKGPTPPESN